MYLNVKWSASRSIKLSRLAVLAFSVLLLALDAFFLFFTYIIPAEAAFLLEKLPVIKACTLICSVPAYVILYNLNALLSNLQQGEVFIPENTAVMRAVSWCCFAVAGVCFICGFKVYSLFVITLAAGFMGLIVRIVKNAFQQANAMKDELDFTV